MKRKCVYYSLVNICSAIYVVSLLTSGLKDEDVNLLTSIFVPGNSLTFFRFA